MENWLEYYKVSRDYLKGINSDDEDEVYYLFDWINSLYKELGQGDLAINLKQIKNYLEKAELNNSSTRIILSKILELFYDFLDVNYVRNFDQNDIENYALKIILVFDKINNGKNHYFNNSNSEQFYSNRINQLTSELNKSHIEKDQLEKLKLELDLTKIDLENIRKANDIKLIWDDKIKWTFENLKVFIGPIQCEKERLEILYNVYMFLAASIVLIIIIIEWLAVYKISNFDVFHSPSRYFSLFIPIPIAGILLWGFIFQMNRAQRQLFSLSNTIYGINYVQGLLLAINSLSPNLDDSIERINKALDKIISNHLESKPIKKESEFQEDVFKDNIQLESILKIIKEIKEVAKA